MPKKLDSTCFFDLLEDYTANLKKPETIENKEFYRAL